MSFQFVILSHRTMMLIHLNVCVMVVHTVLVWLRWSAWSLARNVATHHLWVCRVCSRHQRVGGRLICVPEGPAVSLVVEYQRVGGGLTGVPEGPAVSLVVVEYQRVGGRLVCVPVGPAVSLVVQYQRVGGGGGRTERNQQETQCQTTTTSEPSRTWTRGQKASTIACKTTHTAWWTLHWTQHNLKSYHHSTQTSHTAWGTLHWTHYNLNTYHHSLKTSQHSLRTSHTAWRDEHVSWAKTSDVVTSGPETDFSGPGGDGTPPQRTFIRLTTTCPHATDITQLLLTLNYMHTVVYWHWTTFIDHSCLSSLALSVRPAQLMLHDFTRTLCTFDHYYSKPSYSLKRFCVYFNFSKNTFCLFYFLSAVGFFQYWYLCRITLRYSC